MESPKWSWLASFPSTNGKIISAMGLNWATALVSFYMMLRKIEPPSGVYDGWLFFVAALNGIALGQFGWKRQTDRKYREQESVNPDVTITGADPTVNVESKPAAPVVLPIVAAPPAKSPAPVVIEEPKEVWVKDD